MVSIAEFKQRVRSLRKARRLTQQEFAALADFDYKFYQYLESPRKKQIWLETADRIATAHGIELWQLLHPNFLNFADKHLEKRAVGDGRASTSKGSVRSAGPSTARYRRKVRN